MNAERYTVEHQTRYAYAAPVSQSWQLARLTPRTLPWQKLLSHSLQIDPVPDERRDELDSFGNMVTHFGLHGAHRVLRVRMECQVEVTPRPPVLAHGPTALSPLSSDPLWPALPPPGAPFQMQLQMETQVQAQRQSQGQGQGQRIGQGQGQHQGPGPVASGWEAVRDAIRREPQIDNLVPASMSEPTPLVPLSEGARVYAMASFARGRPWFDAVFDLMRRIHTEFEFEPGATTVSTSVDEVLHQRSGVCQDFAHLMLACLRGLGLPARYVSGYLLTEPPPGMPRLMGVDASHAWVAAYAPQHGWVEFDPTNNQLADQRYITLSWGADFADVVPLRGVIVGGGDQRMSVEVSVIPA
jgi:transglutaminase-like putative cysteine protease